MWGFPFLGGSPSAGLSFYDKVEGYPWSMSGLFIGICLTSAVVTIVLAFVITAEGRAKWRLRFMVGLFSVFPVGFAFVQLSFKSQFIRQAEHRVEIYYEELELYPDRSRYLDDRIERLESLLTKHRE